MVLVYCLENVYVDVIVYIQERFGIQVVNKLGEVKQVIDFSIFDQVMMLTFSVDINDYPIYMV